MTPSSQSTIRTLLNLAGSGPGRIQLIAPAAQGDDWIIQATYGWADRIIATCAYRRDAEAVARALAAALGPDVHLDGCAIA